MDTHYQDYSGDLGLKVAHFLGGVRHVPIRGAGKLGRVLANLTPKPRPIETCLVSTLHGFKMFVDPMADKGVETSIFNFGTYEEGTLRVMSALLKPGDTFVDIGANIGLMSLHAASIVGPSGNVVSFEPLKSTYEILCANIAINEFENVDAKNTAVGASDGVVEIYENKAVNRGSSSLIKPEQSLECHEVPMMRLDRYFEDHDLQSVNCMKIDVEGWELEVLKGATSVLSDDRAPACIVECSSSHPMQGGDTKHIFKYFCDINQFKMFYLARTKETPSKLVEVKSAGNMPTHDNLFCLLPEHLANLPTSILQR